MKSLGFGRVTLCSCVAAAMLAGCGGAQSIAADGAISQNFVDLTQTRASSKSLRHTSVTERVLYSFNGKPDGQEPMGALLDVNGTLYGTTSAGGTINAGTVFAINNGVETIILDFNGSQGAKARHALREPIQAAGPASRALVGERESLALLQQATEASFKTTPILSRR